MQKLDKGTIILFIILIALMATCIYVYLNKILTPTMHNNDIIAKYELEKSKSTEEVEIVEEEVKEQTEEDRILELKSMNETDRIHEYFTEYINTIDARNYEKAYEYLYPEFKQNYFPSQSDFESYINENYPEYLGVEYTDIDRQGTYYILTVRIYNTLEEEITSYLEQKFVIYENNFGEFTLSFQV